MEIVVGKLFELLSRTQSNWYCVYFLNFQTWSSTWTMLDMNLCRVNEVNVVTTTLTQAQLIQLSVYRIDFKGCELRIYAWYSFSFPLKTRCHMHTHTHTKLCPRWLRRKQSFKLLKLLIYITFSCSLWMPVSRFRLSHSTITVCGWNIHYMVFSL